MYSKGVATSESRPSEKVVSGPDDEGPKPKGRRGPRRSFGQDQVVDAAMEVLDEGGPEALSVRAVAGRLGVNPNALYTYVASRSALEREVVERVLSSSDLSLLEPTDGGSDWRARILAYAVALRVILLEHPGVARLMMTAPMDGPSAVLLGERLIGTLINGGLRPDDAARATYALIVQVIGAVALEVAETDGRPPLAPEADRIAQRQAAFGWLDPADWPATAATKHIAAQWISSEQFAWSVARLLDGVAPLPRG